MSPIISGKPYKIVNKQAHNLAIELSQKNHKSILGEKVVPGDVKKQTVGIAFPVNTYCITHVFVVDNRVPPGRRRGNYQITGRPQIVHRICRPRAGRTGTHRSPTPSCQSLGYPTPTVFRGLQVRSLRSEIVSTSKFDFI